MPRKGTTVSMQAHITRHYAANYGDHAEPVTVAYTYDPDERVGDMIARVMGFPLSQFDRPDPEAYIVIRVVSGTEPQEPIDPNAVPF